MQPGDQFLQGIAAIALLIGIWLIAVGVIRVIAAFDVDENRGWNVFAGAVELLAGIAFIVNGMGMFAVGWSLHTVRREVATP